MQKKKCGSRPDLYTYSGTDFGIETKETAHIFIREGIERVCFAQAEGTQSIRQSTKLGTHEPLCYGATGIVLLAFQKPEELGQSLAAMKDYCKDVNLQQLLMKLPLQKIRAIV